jgi:hypothetical protein
MNTPAPEADNSGFIPDIPEMWGWQHKSLSSELDRDTSQFLESNISPIASLRFTPARPLSWYWSHDLPEHFSKLLANMGFTCIRLIEYRLQGQRHTAGLFHKRRASLHQPLWRTLSPEDIRLSNVQGNLKAESLQITNDGVQHRISVLGYSSAESSTRIHLNANWDELQCLVQSGLSIADLLPYQENRSQRFAIITDAMGPTTFVLSGADHAELMFWLKQRRLVLYRLRRYIEDGNVKFAAVAHYSNVRAWSWWIGVDAAHLARKIKAVGGYLVDFDAYLNESGQLRFAAVVYRSRT